MSERDEVVEILRRAISPPFKAVMGRGDGTIVVDGRSGYVWVRKVGKTELLIQAYNRGAPAIEGVVVLVQQSKVDGIKGYEVVGVIPGGDTPSPYPEVPPHAWTHEWRPGIGRDRVTVYPRAWGYLRAEPIETGSANVYVTYGWIYHDGEYIWYPGGYSPSFSGPSVPTGVAPGYQFSWFQTLYMDPSDQSLHIINGVTGIYGENVPPAPSGCMLPICAVESTGTVTAVTENMIEDIRLFMDLVEDCYTGTGDGGDGVGSHNILDGSVHPDSVAQVVSRGSLIYGDSTPKWNELPLGMVDEAVISDGIDVGWGNPIASSTPSVLISLANHTGGQRTANDVVVTHPNIDNSFTGTAVEGYGGKVLVVAETINNLATGTLWERGGPFNINVEGAVARNDGLRTSGTPYWAEAASSPTGTGVFAIALSTSAGPTGTVSALFLDELGTPWEDTEVEWARVYNNADQAVGTGANTALALNSERFDTDGIHDNAVNNSRLTCQTDGKYQISAHFRWEDDAVGVRQLWLRLNGITNIGSVRQAAHGNDMQTISTTYDLVQGDYVELMAFQNSGGNLNVEYVARQSPEFMMIRVGGVGCGGGGGAGTIEIQEDDVKVLDASILNFEGGGGKVTDEGGGKGTIDITGGGGGVTDVLMVQIFS